MTRILFIAPGDNSHTWKWVGWFGRKYPGEIDLLPYQAPVPPLMLPGVRILEPHIPPFKIASVASWTEIGHVRRLVHDVNPRLLHVLWAYGSGTYGARADFHPTILSPWGSEITVFPNRQGLKGAIQRRLILEALNKADYLTATSEFLADAIHNLAPGKSRPDIFPYGVDTSVFDPANPAVVDNPYEFNWPDGCPTGPDAVTVGFFKALKPKYGPEFLVEAIAEASKEVPGLRCVMAGSGELRDSLIEQAKSVGVSNRILFPGRIPYEDMPRALASIDIFAMPSRYEELGVAALEASSMLKPVIVTRKWGMKEVAVDGETGWFIEEGDVKSLAGYLVKLADDSDLRQELGGNGRKFVQSKYEFDTIMQSADRYCTEIIERGT
jgi:glycosyltransferase involved in cell wall biosynthesis